MKTVFYVCVEDNRDLEIGMNIAHFLLSLGIPTLKPTFKLNIGGCLVDRYNDFKKMYDFNDIILVCVSRTYRKLNWVLSKHSLSPLDRILHFVFPRKFYLGSFGEFKNGLRFIMLHMPTIEKVKASPLAVFIHEFLHLKRPEECKTSGCLGHGHPKTFWMCKECSDLFHEIVNEFGVGVDEVVLHESNNRSR